MALNVALIGLGMVADTHLAALSDLKTQVKLRGVYTSTSQSMTSFLEKAEASLGYRPLAYSSTAQIASDNDLDFAIIATPPNARMEFVTPLAKAGCHILMEKPIERTSKTATDIVTLCELENIKLGVVFQHRARSVVATLRNLIASDDLGKLEVVEVSVPWWRDQSYYDVPGRGTLERDGGGVLISQAIHTLDLMLSLAGPVAEVQALAATTGFHKMDTEDFVSAGLVFETGAVGHLHATTASFPGSSESITLHFNNAVAKLSSSELTLRWRNGKTESFGKAQQTGGGADPMAFTHDWHRRIIENFACAVEFGDALIAPGKDALAVHVLVDALMVSAKQKCAIRVEGITHG